MLNKKKILYNRLGYYLNKILYNITSDMSLIFNNIREIANNLFETLILSFGFIERVIFIKIFNEVYL